MYNSQEIVERIKFQAKKKNLSISKMLSICGLGPSTISKMANNTDILTKNFAKIADCLDCSVDYLLGRTEIEKINNLPQGLYNAIMEVYDKKKGDYLPEDYFMHYPNLQSKNHWIRGEDWEKVMKVYEIAENYCKEKNICIFLGQNEYMDLFVYSKKYGFENYTLTQGNYLKFHEIYKLYEKSFVDTSQADNS